MKWMIKNGITYKILINKWTNGRRAKKTQNATKEFNENCIWVHRQPLTKIKIMKIIMQQVADVAGSRWPGQKWKINCKNNSKCFGCLSFYSTYVLHKHLITVPQQRHLLIIVRFTPRSSQPSNQRIISARWPDTWSIYDLRNIKKWRKWRREEKKKN